jgi:hypothetical protein
MRKLSLRILVALITLIISVSSSWLLHRPTKPSPVAPAPCPTPTPETVPISYNEDDAEYPDDKDLSPWEISWFIDAHPRAKLKKLWARLHIKEGNPMYLDFSQCFDCSAKVDFSDLDG